MSRVMIDKLSERGIAERDVPVAMLALASFSACRMRVERADPAG